MKKGWLVFLVLLAAATLTLSGILLGKFSREEKIFQEQAALNGIVYDEVFLEEAAKLPGIQSVKPVVSLPVQLKVGEYSVETELLGVELTDLHYQAEKASDEGQNQKNQENRHHSENRIPPGIARFFFLGDIEGKNLGFFDFRLVILRLLMDRAEGILVGQCQGATHRAVFFRVRGTRIVSDGLHRAGAHINLHDAFPFRPRVEIP